MIPECLMCMVWCFDCIIFNCMFDLQSEFIMDIVHFLCLKLNCKHWYVLIVDMCCRVNHDVCNFFVVSDWKYMFRDAAVCWNWWCNQFNLFLCIQRIMQNTQIKDFKSKPWVVGTKNILLLVWVFFWMYYFGEQYEKKGWDMMFHIDYVANTWNEKRIVIVSIHSMFYFFWRREVSILLFK